MENPIWETEEKAMIFFKSVTKRHVPATSAIPNNLTTKTQSTNGEAWRNFENRSMPIPPSLNRTPARIIDP